MGWVKVARRSDLKQGRGTTVFVEGREVALFLVNEKPYCIDNSCPHMDGPLADGDLEGEIVYCPWHYWPINVRTGETEYDPGLCTQTFPCKVEDDTVFIDIEAKG